MGASGFCAGEGAVLGKTAATSADLSTPAFANVPAGVGSYVLSRGRIYWSVPVGKGDLAGTGNDWKSDPSTSDPTFRTHPAWFVSNVGNDDNTGADSAHPIATVQEIQSRWGVNVVIRQAVTITFLTDHPGGTLTYAKGAAGAILVVDGTTTVVLSDTVATYAVVNTVTNVWTRITATGVVDWTAHVNRRIRFTNGPANNAVTFVLLQNPQGSGVGTAEINYPLTPPTSANFYVGSQLDPVAGNSFDLETLHTIDQFVIDCVDANENVQAGVAAVANPAYLVQNLYVKTVGARANSRGATDHNLYGMKTDNWTDTQPATRSGSLFASGCLFTYAQARINPANYQRCAFKSIDPAHLTQLASYDPIVFLQCIFEGVGCNLSSGSYNLNALGIFNAPAVGLTCNSSTVVQLSTFLVGQGNGTFGVQLGTQTQMFYPAATVLKLTGTTTDWRFSNGPQFTWAQAPRQNNFGSGTDTLGIGGTKVVTVPNLPADAKIVVSPNTPSGVGSPGVLSAPTAGRAANSFTANSTVAADRMTFDFEWSSPSGGSGGLFIGAA